MYHIHSYDSHNIIVVPRRGSSFTGSGGNFATSAEWNCEKCGVSNFGERLRCRGCMADRGTEVCVMVLYCIVTCFEFVVNCMVLSCNVIVVVLLSK